MLSFQLFNKVNKNFKFIKKKYEKKLGGHPETPFNRAKLLNIGFDLLKAKKFDCFIFFDVDIFPMNDEMALQCLAEEPRHLSTYTDKYSQFSASKKFDYSNEEKFFSGASAFRKETFETLNGFSNQFWGWGGKKDIDLFSSNIKN